MMAYITKNYVDLALKYFWLDRKLFEETSDERLASYFSALFQELNTLGELDCRDISFLGKRIEESVKKYGKPPRVKKLIEFLKEDRENRWIMEVW